MKYFPSKTLALILCSVVVLAAVLLWPRGNKNGGGGETFYYEGDWQRAEKIATADFPRPETLLLSDFIDSLCVVTLDSEDPEALIGTYVAPTISENFIGIKSSEPNMPFRLFDRRTGKFVRTIGNIGRGPGEYTGLYAWAIDEPGDRVFLVPFARSTILEYTLGGDFVKQIDVAPSDRKMGIELCDSLIIAYMLPFEGDSVAVRTLTRAGEIVSTTPNPMGGARSFDNELYVNKGGEKSGYMVSNVPVYYHFDRAKNVLEPVFAIDNKDGGWYGEFHESPSRYLIKVFHAALENGQKRPLDYFLSIDKRSGKRAAGQLVNDFWGGIETANSSHPDMYYYDHYMAFENGYYLETIPASILKRLLKEAIDRGRANERVRKLYDSFDEEDNHFVFYGKLK